MGIKVKIGKDLSKKAKRRAKNQKISESYRAQKIQCQNCAYLTKNMAKSTALKPATKMTQVNLFYQLNFDSNQSQMFRDFTQKILVFFEKTELKW